MREALQAARDALKAADQFITNGIALGYIRMPDRDCPDTAHRTPGEVKAALSLADASLSAEPVGELPQAEPVEMSPEFTDTARAALLWVLWHHQGYSSPVGQPLRFALGMGRDDHLSEHQIAEAKRWAAVSKSSTADFHRYDDPAPVSVPGYVLVPECADEPMQKAMQRAVLMRKSMNDVWRAALSELPEALAASPSAALATESRQAEPVAGADVMALLDALKDDAAVHIWPNDLEKCNRSECVVKVYSVRMGSHDGKTVPLFSREQVQHALDTALKQRQTEPVAWINVLDRIPQYQDGEDGMRVLVLTADHDFAGVQVHDIPASDFYAYDPDGNEPGSEVTKVATHWMPRHTLLAALQQPAPPTAQADEARDAARLDWMSQHEAWVGWTREGDYCRVWVKADDPSDRHPRPVCGWDVFFENHRAAIDAAIAAQKGEQP